MMNELYDLCENLKDEIKEMNKKGDLSPAELDNAYKAVDIIKDIKTIEAMEESRYSYYANDGGSYNSYNSYDEGMMSNARRGRDGDGDGRYSEEGSYRRGRDARGRYVSRDGSYDDYSRHDEKEQIRKQIEQMQRRLDQMK